MNHMLEKKGSKRKRRLSRPDAEVAPADGNRIRKLLAK
jgi:ribosomal protein L35